MPGGKQDGLQETLSSVSHTRGAVLYAPVVCRRLMLAAVACALLAAGWYLHRRIVHRAPAPIRTAWLKAHTPTGMVFVPAGWFRMGGGGAGDDSHREWTPAFYIDQYPVTNRQFSAFYRNFHYPKGQGDYPVTNVTWRQATDYLKARGEALPTEAEWEKAARGTDGRVFPWGNSASHWLDTSVKRRAFQPVTKYPQPASPYGAHDMCGTVWQWVRDNRDNNPRQQIIRGGAAGYPRRNDTTFNRGIEGVGVT
ncbi:MAG TPA: SUMF1/EgtB/PvdO family nonheme iron enzyme [Armatimonadota bacterium]|nr:SUMF1/EgtB/PvdO family nonheme iron enzyme [Armatimonadota bacterium]